MDIVLDRPLRGHDPSDLMSPTAFLQRPIGAGSFKFKEFVPNSHMMLVSKVISDLDVQAHSSRPVRCIFSP